MNKFTHQYVLSMQFPIPPAAQIDPGQEKSCKRHEPLKTMAITLQITTIQSSYRHFSQFTFDYIDAYNIIHTHTHFVYTN